MLTNLLLVIIRFRLLVYLAAVIMLVCGVIAATRLPVDALPNLSENQLLVYTRWPDRMPAEIYEQITRPLADSFRSVEDVVTVRGSSDVGFSLLYVIFKDNIGLEDARRRIETQLQRRPVALPAGVQPQIAPEGIATGQIVWYTLRGQNTDLLELRAWQDQLIAPRIRSIPGVAEVASVGGFEPEVNVDLNAQAMMEHGLAFEDVWQRVEKLQLSSHSNNREASIHCRAW
jgi:copper/silver efflux system protein